MTIEAPLALILDEESEHTRKLESLLQANGFRTVVSDGGVTPDLEPVIAFLCLDLASVDVIEFITKRVMRNAIEIILMAGRDDPQRVRRGIASGATYFFCKPFDSEFLETLVRDVRADTGDKAQRISDPDVRPLDQFGLLRGNSPAMRKLFRVLRKVSPTDTSVLLIGESGTGKELAARTLHDMSEVADGPFIATNCAALPKELFESELFGHEKGSFSGADRQHRGFFERAAGGTLFLDEITEMPLELQVKLLRVLEMGAFRRVGGEEDIRSSVRIVAATNRPPDSAIREGLLREDLYYRIARFPIRLPPLRNRGSDIDGLTRYFLGELNLKNAAARTIDDAAMAVIRRHTWPGNVRELQSAVERAWILAEAVISPQHLPPLEDHGDGEQLRISVGESIGDAERKLIFATLESNDGDKAATAEILGVSLKTLYNRLKQYAAEDARRDEEDSAG